MILISAFLAALIIDRFIGWPAWLYQRLSHPVVAIGALISWLDKQLNNSSRSDFLRRLFGVLCVMIVCCICLLVSLLPALIYTGGIIDGVIIAILAWPFLAAKSLKDHVAMVAMPLLDNDTDTARQAVAMIVGRNANTLDDTAIARASIESLAENTSDGVIAPLFWGMIFGLPGLIIYKAINTMDSMIGYRNAQYKDFGWAAARLDDVVNFIPARLTAFLYALSTKRFFTCLKTIFRDGAKHRSPNAGWPESAMAAALNRRLSGPRIYDGVKSNDAWLYGEGADPDGQDVMKAIHLYDILLNWVIFIAMVSVISMLFYGYGRL